MDRSQTHQLIKGLYVIGEPKNTDYNVDLFLQRVETLLQAGIKIFQLRVKQNIYDKEYLSLAKTIRRITSKYGALFIINDRPDLVVLSEADGLHLGPQDIPPSEARKIIGNKILGISNHSFDEFIENKDHPDVDYLSMGPIFPTDSKIHPDPVVGVSILDRSLPLIRPNQQGIKKPTVAIGGINEGNLESVVKTGVSSVGIIRALMNHDHPYDVAKDMIHQFEVIKKKYQ